MGRKPRQQSSVGLYHVITRGNNKSRLFHGEEDFKEIRAVLKDYLEEYPLKIHHYCLMTNHIHLLVWAEELATLSRFMHGVQRSYHHYYRKAYTWFGHLFQGRYRSLPIEDEAYLLDCGRYIERNPVRAKMVEDPKDWEYSSYCFYAYGRADALVSPSIAYQALTARSEEDRCCLYRTHVEATRPYEEIIDRDLVGT